MCSMHDQSPLMMMVMNHVGLQVKFYAPWCEHSKAIKSEFEQAAIILGQVRTMYIERRTCQIPIMSNNDKSQHRPTLMLELMKLVLMLVMTQEGSPIRLAEVDASEEKVLAKREGVRSFVFSSSF